MVFEGGNTLGRGGLLAMLLQNGKLTVLRYVNQGYPLATCQHQDFTVLYRENWHTNSAKKSKNCQNIDRVLSEQS